METQKTARYPGPQPTRRSLAVLTLLAVVAIGVLIGLGNWQMRRLNWKTTLIQTVNERANLVPVSAPGPSQWVDFQPEQWAFRPVVVTGRFHHDKEIHLFASLARPRGRFGGPGYNIHTPLETADGWFVWVNRGFVPGNYKDPGTRESGQIINILGVTGLTRIIPPRGPYVPDDDIAANVWFARDLLAMSENAGLAAKRVAPFVIDAGRSMLPTGGLPQSGETRLKFTNSHLQYALTWYGLACALAAVLSALLWTQRAVLLGRSGRLIG